MSGSRRVCFTFAAYFPPRSGSVSRFPVGDGGAFHHQLQDQQRSHQSINLFETYLRIDVLFDGWVLKRAQIREIHRSPVLLNVSRKPASFLRLHPEALWNTQRSRRKNCNSAFFLAWWVQEERFPVNRIVFAWLKMLKMLLVPNLLYSTQRIIDYPQCVGNVWCPNLVLEIGLFFLFLPS